MILKKLFTRSIVIPIVITLLFCISGMTEVSYGATVNEVPCSKVISKGSLDEFDDGETIASFRYDGTSVYRIYLSVSKNYEDLDTDSCCLFMLEEDVEFEDYEEYEISGDIYAGKSKYIILDSKKLKKGYTYTFDVMMGENTKLKYNVKRYNGYADIMTIDDNITVNVNDSKSISISEILPAYSFPKIQWSSSNKKIATVNSFGKVTAKKVGKTVISAVMSNGNIHTCEVTVKNPAPYLKWKSYEIGKGSSFKNKLCYSTGNVIWSSTNKKVATVDKNGKVKAVGFGTCYIKAKSKGKTYKCKVKVVRLLPNYTACIWDYDTRNNRFHVKFKNHGTRNIIIYSGDAVALDDDYKSYDRDLRLAKGKSSVTVKPNTTKSVYFYVKGGTTWHDEDDFTIRYYFKYHGKKYKGRVRSDIGFSDYYRNGEGWYYTYWKNIAPYGDIE